MEIEATKNEAIKVVTLKVLLDIMMGYSKDTDEQIKLLRELADDIEYQVEEEIRKEEK